MIILSVLLIALLLLASAIVVRCVFKPKWVWLNKVIVAALVIACAFGILSGFMSAACQGQVDNLKDEAKAIILYYNTINESDNEYVRFDFYQRVKDYNVRYTNLQDNTESAWIGAFYPKGWDLEKIDKCCDMGVAREDFWHKIVEEAKKAEPFRTIIDPDYEEFFGNEVPDGDAVG